MTTNTKVRQDSSLDIQASIQAGIQASIQAGRHKNRQLQPNPFTTYRDPETGRWVVIKPTTA